ncbi:hypothetical protein EFA46_015120 (plasmid) [Halarchaeum sp. CBA1220]|uniref:metallophosphoesterase family protein n=1 Tax=Halarchaeum sp. CBA1220 TaxID=1853682 RepID=UPI000F3A9A8F|nr:metallophosphoesterase family protein [Halarchaeum sp. CBA1220]QLC35558.1 hypothetical protein EFA46_015120 [Halarchaeum sp. CBA1220]
MYVLSDTHFGHANIIDYCERPFESVEEMNEALIENWNASVEADDEVVFVGDLTIDGSAEAFLRWITRLNGDIVFVVGDHDHEVLTTLDDVVVYEHYRFEYGGKRFYCVHDPDDAPTNVDSWVLHGHHHNNWPDDYPFVNPDERRVNVSVELLDYGPLSLERLVAALEQSRQLADVSELD